MRKVLSILLLLLFCLSAKAYDFVVGKIAYSVVSMNDSICEVEHKKLYLFKILFLWWLA